MRNDRTLALNGSDWQAKIKTLQELLDEIRPKIVTAETELADRLATITLFEYRIRVKLSKLTNHLENIQDQVQRLRHRLRQMQRQRLFDLEEDEEDMWFDNDAWNFDTEYGAASSGDYRYHTAPSEAIPTSLNSEDSKTLKQLYRQLARRFHPDFAMDNNDRSYRTQIMMAINAAYAVGDLARLQKLAEEPDHAASTDYNNAELVQALYRELIRCRRRLKEIKGELIQLRKHHSTKMMQKMAHMAKQGRDMLAEMAHDLRERIVQQQVERDVLLIEIKAFGQGEPEFMSESLADTVYDLGLEQGLIYDE